jgi:hypothetical protein
MQFEAHFSTENALIRYSQELLPNAAYSVTEYGCTTALGANSCAPEHFVRSFQVVVPEPGTLRSPGPWRKLPHISSSPRQVLVS